MGTSRFSGNPTPEEAASVIAALEQFQRDNAPSPLPEPQQQPSPWKRAALMEGVTRGLDVT